MFLSSFRQSLRVGLGFAKPMRERKSRKTSQGRPTTRRLRLERCEYRRLLVIELHNDGKISDELFNGIKAAVNNNNLNWDNLPDIYESYQIEGLGSWQSP
jgi:hypothetical protein